MIKNTPICSASVNVQKLPLKPLYLSGYWFDYNGIKFDIRELLNISNTPKSDFLFTYRHTKKGMKDVSILLRKIGKGIDLQELIFNLPNSFINNKVSNYEKKN